MRQAECRAEGGPLSSGARVYEEMSNVQKQLLRDYLSSKLGATSDWRRVVSRRVEEVVRRRARSGESLDAHDVVGEVLPFSRSIIPAEVREGLFRHIAGALRLSDAQD
ncbi:uncharacterized protein Tco025E_06435 [Trypanosoma conorhini]|uniref:Transcription and mRNA export factor ENY2 n=1 Tax=Trypanosoma conorhini TaxID=83891 RepID=A0A3R7KZ82_9TRYP|nr:uncharacterized protein Tco025E_06435 [Trypanosoma conorhini]RNF12585.1 hypothetical protein Tco025E_06435 [Trypanosoma conorhini]